jgi:hypothetical protein
MKNYLNPHSLLKLYIPPLYIYTGVRKMNIKNLFKPQLKDTRYQHAKNTQPLSVDEMFSGWVIMQGEEFE